MLFNHVRINRIYVRRHLPRSWALANVTVVMATCLPRASAGPGPGDTAVNKAGPDPEVVSRVQGSKHGSRRQGVDAKVFCKGLRAQRGGTQASTGGAGRGERQVPVPSSSGVRGLKES